MPKVVNNTCELQIPFPATTVQQTLAQINILTSPTLIEFIITVYLDKILTEEGHVTAQCSRTLSTVSRSQEASQPYTMDCILRLAFNSFRPDMNRAYHTGLTYFLCQLFAQVYPSTFHVNATAGFTEMVGYQLWMQEHITVYLYDIPVGGINLS